MNLNCLIISKSKPVISDIQNAFSDLRCETDKVKGAFEALGYLRLKKFDFIFLDKDIPLIDSLEMVKMIKKIQKTIPVIMVSPPVADREELLRENTDIYDFLDIPVKKKQVIEIAGPLIYNIELYVYLKILYKELEKEYGFNHIIGKCPSMKQVFEALRKIKSSSVTAFIFGESGTGKELVARQIHSSSPRADNPFVAVNIAAIPETLVESELFGHEKGSFTGAMNTRIGRFEQANTGTLFLDEIGEMSLNIQSKLLRILEEREFERVGGSKTIKTDVRIITATNKNLEEEVEEGRFRRDLYYRIKVFPIELPPLRERVEDIPMLTIHLLEQLSRKNNRPFMTITKEAMDKLATLSWPGNIRELENVLERAILIASGNCLTPDDFIFPGMTLPEQERMEDRLLSKGEGPVHSMEYWEKIIIEDALKTLNWNVTQAAKELNIGRATLHRKIQKYNLFNNGNPPAEEN